MENKYQLYDRIVALSLMEIFKHAKENNNTITIEVNNKFFKNKEQLCLYELSKIVQNIFDIKIVINCNTYNYIKYKIKFKPKKYKVTYERTNSKEKNINEIDFLAASILSKLKIAEKSEIFEKIYNEYYDPKNFKKR